MAIFMRDLQQKLCCFGTFLSGPFFNSLHGHGCSTLRQIKKETVCVGGETTGCFASKPQVCLSQLWSLTPVLPSFGHLPACCILLCNYPGEVVRRSISGPTSQYLGHEVTHHSHDHSTRVSLACLGGPETTFATLVVGPFLSLCTGAKPTHSILMTSYFAAFLCMCLQPGSVAPST